MHAAAPPRKTDAVQSAAAGTPPPRLAFAALVVANMALATGPLFVRAASTGPVAAAFWRIALAMPLLAALSLAAGARPQRLPSILWIMLAVAGVAFAADLGTWHLGIVRTTMANATLFGNCATLVFPLYGFLAARAWPTRTQGLALLLAAIGGGLLLGRSYQVDPRNLGGDMLCLAAGLLYTGYFVVMARVRTRMAPLSALTLSSLASLPPLLLFVAASGEALWPADWTPLIPLALIPQVIGQGCMIYALGKLSPLVIGIALLIQPVVAGAIGWIGFGERLGAPDLVGVAMVAAALVLVRGGGPLAPGDADAHVEAKEPR